MKKILAIALVGLVAAGTQADIVSVNLTQYINGLNNIADGYGVETANNWLQTTGTVGSNVIQDSGTGSGVAFALAPPATFAQAAGGGTYNNTAMRAGLFVYATPVVLNLAGLFNFCDGGSYDIIVYGSGFNAAAGGNIGSYSDGTTTYYMQRAVTHDATLIQSSDINAVDGADEGNYVVFSGLSGDTQNITISTVNGSTGIGGFQIVAIPEPATLGLVAAFGGAILFVRRKFMI